MKRIEQKVKDLIELRPYVSPYDFARGDLAKALTSYHFTDITSDLMSKWVGKIARVVEGGGAAYAMAGFRGVGKSHFLNALGAIVSIPDVRSRIADPLVGSTAHGLGRRRFNLVWIRRGSDETLLAELKTGISELIGEPTASLSDSLSELISLCMSRSQELPLVILVDTALERSERVARDDGQVLGEIAEAAKRQGFFVGIALDDDIAGADGVNSAITKSFTIDYLDQEHLYKIVDSHIFPKNPKTQAVLHEIYEDYRRFVPGFRWSEPRFASLYPLHPAIMEIAPFVRLYLHEFALLGFASDAGARILGRPANSLIAPDEVFDNIEASLRTVPILAAVFDTFDRLNRDVVAKTPVVKRLQAKLILKGVLLFSLSEEGTTASEIGASMLIFDEADPQAAIDEIESVLAAFAAAAPDGISVSFDENKRGRYAFRLDAKDELRSALEMGIASVSSDNIESVLQRLMTERFPDCGLGINAAGEPIVASDSYLLWRGGVRKGSVRWNYHGQLAGRETTRTDWNVVVEAAATGIESTDETCVGWIPAQLAPEDRETLARFWLLQNDPDIRAAFNEHIASAIQTHAAASAKLFQRMFLDNAALSIGGFEYNFTDEARTSATLTQVFTTMLEPLFESRYPEHPFFPHAVEMRQVALLATDFFSGSRVDNEAAQRAASTSCVPLGLAISTDAGLRPATADVLRELPYLRDIFAAIEDDADSSLTLQAVRDLLGAAPRGLVNEAVYLVLTAMVSARMLDFVTTHGDRINHRSLDLQIIWDDIVAVALPIDSGHSRDRLMLWANKLVEPGKDLLWTKPDHEADVQAALTSWLVNWRQRAVAAGFEKVDDCLLTATIWRAAFSIKAFESVAETIEQLNNGSLSLEDTLTRIADAFSDSEGEYSYRLGEIEKVANFLEFSAIGEEARGYMSMCEPTGVFQLDDLRLSIWDSIADGSNRAEGDANRMLANDWGRFQRLYVTHFAEAHDAMPSAADLKDKLNEIQKTDVWWEFESLASSRAFDRRARTSVFQQMAAMRRLDCDLRPAEMLKYTPACACGFSLGLGDEIDELPRRLWAEINRALAGHREQLRGRAKEIKGMRSQGFSQTDIDPLLKLLEDQKDLRRFTEAEVRMIKALPSSDSAPSAVKSGPATTSMDEIDAILEALK